MKSPFGQRKRVLPDYWETYAQLFKRTLNTNGNSIPVVVLDTETTGFDFRRDRILSIGALRLEGGMIAVNKTFEIYITQDRFDSNSVKIHGILKNQSRSCIPESEAMQKLLNYLQNAVIIGHHTYFDIMMINKALNRNGLPDLLNKTLDTAVLYPKTLIASPLRTKKDNYTLDDLADAYDISRKDRHTALGDAYITAIAFLKIYNRISKKERQSLGIS